MANYYASARSNYFMVHDVDAFKNELRKYSPYLVVETKLVNETDLLTTILVDDPNDSGFPYDYLNDNDEYVEIDWTEIFKRHLKDNWVAILLEIGSEKLRFLTGIATGFNNKGEVKQISLNDLAHFETLGDNITQAEY
jgi:hypothetical protein